MLFALNQLQNELKYINLREQNQTKLKSPKIIQPDLYNTLVNFMNKYTIINIGYAIQAIDLRKKFNYMCDKNESHVLFSRLMDKYT